MSKEESNSERIDEQVQEIISYLSEKERMAMECKKECEEEIAGKKEESKEIVLHLNVREIINNYVQEIAQVRFSNDKTCPPEFIVSLLRAEQKLILTINHLGSVYSTTIPLADTSIRDVMDKLYAEIM